MTSAYAYPLLIKQLLHTPMAVAAEQEIIHAQVSRYTYRDFGRRIAQLANALTQRGAGPGSVIAVMDWDSHRYLECFFAVPMLGATLHTVNIRLSAEQILFTINHAADDFILVHEDFAELLGQIASRITRPVTMIVMRDAAVAGGSRGPSDALGFVGEYETLLADAAPAYAFADFDENTRATLFYTTGTTGDPKGVSYSHRQLVLHTLAVATGLGGVPGNGGLHRADVYMPITPLFHAHGWGIPYVATLLGLKQIYPGRYEPEKLLRLIATHDVTFSHCVPTILSMILASAEAATTDLSRWKVIIGGSALPEGLARLAVAHGIDIHAAYGLSETCPFLTSADMVASRGAGDTVGIRTVAGRPAPLVELRVVDPHMLDVPRDGKTPGEVVARAPWLVQAYLNNPAATDALWAGGYLHTGDVGTLDATGTLRITDRFKDVIKSGGEWISSLELEDIVSAVAGVREVAAIGLPDAKWGERPALVVACVASGTEAAMEKAIRAAIDARIVAGQLSKWAAPNQLFFASALPKTSVGKLDKKAMRVTYA